MFVFRKKEDGKSEYVGYAREPIRRSVSRPGKPGVGELDRDEWKVDKMGGTPYKVGKHGRAR
jgi:hypothetical protein